MAFGLTQPGIEPESSVSAADTLPTDRFTWEAVRTILKLLCNENNQFEENHQHTFSPYSNAFLNVRHYGSNFYWKLNSVENLLKLRLEFCQFQPETKLKSQRGDSSWAREVRWTHPMLGLWMLNACSTRRSCWVPNDDSDEKCLLFGRVRSRSNSICFERSCCAPLEPSSSL